MNSLPIISLEIRQMKHTVQTMLMEHAAMLDKQVNDAINLALSDGAIDQMIKETVKAEINSAVKSEIQDQFRYSAPGREAIRQAIKKHADEYWGPRNYD
jgi:hypothetical protein